jgi:hypothetical protein
MSKLHFISAGSDARPASQEDLDLLRDQLDNAFKEGGDFYFITPHEVQYNFSIDNTPDSQVVVRPGK